MSIEGEIMNTASMAAIPGYDGYFITKEGAIYSTLKSKSPQRRKTCVTPRDGYECVWLFSGGKKTYRQVHQLVLRTFVGPPSQGQECRHLNGDKLDNRLANLKWGSRSENCIDRERHGTGKRGEKNHNAKLSKSDVLAIRSSLEKQSDIARQFGIDPSHVSDIKRRKRWGHV